MMNKRFEKLQYAIVIAVFAIGIALTLAFTIDNPKYNLILDSRSLLLQAFFSTIYISIATLIGAMLFGFVLFVMMRAKLCTPQ